MFLVSKISGNSVFLVSAENSAGVNKMTNIWPHQEDVHMPLITLRTLHISVSLKKVKRQALVGSRVKVLIQNLQNLVIITVIIRILIITHWHLHPHDQYHLPPAHQMPLVASPAAPAAQAPRKPSLKEQPSYLKVMVVVFVVMVIL